MAKDVELGKTKTEQAKLAALRSPSKDDPVWGSSRISLILGEYLGFSTTKEWDCIVDLTCRQTGKQVSVKVHNEQFYFHFLHVKWERVRTFKVYRHQGVWMYLDSWDVDVNMSTKTYEIDKSRKAMLAKLAKMAGWTLEEADAWLFEMSNGN